jgi:hypothetical protein
MRVCVSKFLVCACQYTSKFKPAMHLHSIEAAIGTLEHIIRPQELFDRATLGK